MTLVEIREHLEGIRERWRSGTTVERQWDLVHLEGLPGELDDLRVEPDAVADAEDVDQVRGRIEILMDEIEISVGMDPRDEDAARLSRLGHAHLKCPARYAFTAQPPAELRPLRDPNARDDADSGDW